MDLQKLLDQMTLEEKIGQMTQVTFATFTQIPEVEITGEWQGDARRPFRKHDLGTALGTVTADTAISVQKEHLKKDRNHIPLLLMRDVIHGHTTIYPIPLAMGASFNESLMEECAAMAAREASACGTHITFSPMVDYVRDARWGRVMETCGEDPFLNGRMGAAMVRGYQGKDLKDPASIAACVKHFAAYGAAEAGRDYNCAEISEYSLREYYLPAYRACLEAGAQLVMPSFNTLNGIPATANPHLKQILREEWGFDGVVISDWGAVKQCVDHGFAEDQKAAAKAALENGCDVEMCSFCYNDHIKELVEEGAVSVEAVDRAVMRILKLKEKLGLFENPYHGASLEKQNELLLCPEHRALVRRAAEESAVLMKNEGVLPFSLSLKKIALIGPYAEEHAINGKWSAAGRAADTVNVLEGVRALLPDAEITVVKGCGMKKGDLDFCELDRALEAAKEAEAVILCVGEDQDQSGEARSRTRLNLPGFQEEMIRRVAAANPNTAVLLFNGRPLVLTGWQKNVPAILEMFFPGTEGGAAAASLIFGKVNPSGKLTMSFPKTLGQCPIYYSHASTGRPRSKYIDCDNLPLYSFGYGLSYTTFKALSLEISNDTLTPGKELAVRVRVANTGSRPGSEVVQLYLKDHAGSTVRPVQKLIDFRKIALQPGEEREVCFRVDEKSLEMWSANEKYETEPGVFSLYTGYADHLELEKEFRFVRPL